MFLLSYKFKSRFALNADGRNRTAFSTLKRKQPWRFTIKRHQHNTEMLASTNRFWILLLIASLYYITAWTKKYYTITKEERSSPIIVKFAVIKLRGGFKPRFCHTRPIVCPSWTSASSATRKHCYITMLNVRVKRAATLMTSFLLNHRDKANIGNCLRKRCRLVSNFTYPHKRLALYWGFILKNSYTFML